MRKTFKRIRDADNLGPEQSEARNHGSPEKPHLAPDPFDGLSDRGILRGSVGTLEHSMPMKPNSRAYAAIRALVRDVEDLIDGEKWSLDRKAAHDWKETPWAGAGLVICEALPKDPSLQDTYVVSPYVVELSWLVDYLKNVCSAFVNYQNKNAFYGRLGDAANRYLSQRSIAHRNPKDLCFAVVREAMRVIEDADRGELSTVRNEVQIKQIWVQLHPGAAHKSAGLAIYWCPSSRGSSLANEQFSFRGKTYRVGETTELIPQDGQVMHMAEYHEVG